MERKLLWKAVFVILLVVFAATASVTTVVKLSDTSKVASMPESLKSLFPGINLGLDLQGGLRLI